MSKILAPLTAALLNVACATVALATPPLMGNIIGKQAFHGPGSRGFLETCSSTFSVTNFALGSNNFLSTSWTAEGSTSPAIAAPTVTGGATDPNGGTSAFSVTFPAVTGTHAYSVLSQTISDAVINDFPRTFFVTAKVTSGATNGSIFVSVGSGSITAQAPIPNDGNWHVIKASPGFASGLGANPALQIGVNLFTAQSPTTGPITISLFTSAYIRDPISRFIRQSNISGALATTTTAVTVPITILCPSGVAFRDFRVTLPRTGLAPSTSNPPNANELYQAAAVGTPFSPLYSGGSYWAFGNVNSSITPSMLVSFSLYKSRDGLNWTEDTTNAPYLTAFGSVLASVTIGAAGSGFTASASGTMTWAGGGCTVPPVLNVTTNSSGQIATATFSSGACQAGSWPTTQTTWTPSGIGSGSGTEFSFATTPGTGLASQWQLHTAWLPFGCTVAGTTHKFCVLFSARGTSNSTASAAIYLAYADTIDGIYTINGCSSGTCASPTPVIPTNTKGHSD